MARAPAVRRDGATRATRNPALQSLPAYDSVIAWYVSCRAI